ncbi:MAG: hypothetical protein LH472_08980 [Pyrinomonadaceae bacterium]|nr:hypothetical protein [Pyrinomonadaceae bacterium]
MLAAETEADLIFVFAVRVAAAFGVSAFGVIVFFEDGGADSSGSAFIVSVFSVSVLAISVFSGSTLFPRASSWLSLIRAVEAFAPPGKSF